MKLVCNVKIESVRVTVCKKPQFVQFKRVAYASVRIPEKVNHANFTS
jgi:hypothetical protein